MAIKNIIGNYKGGDIHPYGKYTLYLVEGNEGYLRKIALDAFRSENKLPPEGVDLLDAYRIYRFQGRLYASLDGNFSSFARVTRRVEYRLANNKWIEKIHLNIKEVAVFNRYGYLDHYDCYTVQKESVE